MFKSSTDKITRSDQGVPPSMMAHVGMRIRLQTKDCTKRRCQGCDARALSVPLQSFPWGWPPFFRSVASSSSVTICIRPDKRSYFFGEEWLSKDEVGGSCVGAATPTQCQPLGVDHRDMMVVIPVAVADNCQFADRTLLGQIFTPSRRRIVER